MLVEKAGSVPNKTSLPLPLWLLAEVSYKCPLHCVFCYNPVDYATYGKELSTEDWLRVLRQGRELGATQLGFSGGEPLVRTDLEIMIAEARKLGYYSNLITSGVGLDEKRIAAFKEGGLDHIQVSFQDSTREMNDFLSSTRTFELKQKVARLVKKYDYPMVLNVVLHRFNIDHVQQILEMAEQLEAEYVELANTQYYGWAYVNRDKLLPEPRSIEARRRSHQQIPRAGGQSHADLLRRAGLLRNPSQTVHERLGKCVSWRHRRRARAAVSRGAHAAGADVPQREGSRSRLDLERVAGVQRVPRRQLDEGAVPLLPGKSERLRRLPVPGVPDDGRCRRMPIPCATSRRTTAWSPIRSNGRGIVGERRSRGGLLFPG